MEFCSEKCIQNPFHQYEIDVFANAKLEGDFVELQTPLRAIGMKEKDPKKFELLKSLVSNKDYKVKFDVSIQKITKGG